MAKAGSEYQDDAAAFFRTLGLKAEVEKEVEGARGKHKIDVWVTGRIHAFDVRWVIECKDWKSNVPKEKVLALQAIVQDVGADRGFLLSETGFQSGAVQCAEYTNITLTSLQTLRASTNSYMARWIINHLHQRGQMAYRMVEVIPGEFEDHEEGYKEVHPDVWEVMMTLVCLNNALAARLRGASYPISLDRPIEMEGGATPVAANDDDLIAIATRILEKAEPFIAQRLPR